jgi:hypothetical protein
MVPVHAVDNVFRQRKSTMCLVVCRNKMVPTMRSINCHIAHAKFLCFSSKTTRLSSLDALNRTILLWKPYFITPHSFTMWYALRHLLILSPHSCVPQQLPKLSSTFQKMNFASPTWAQIHFVQLHNPSDAWEGNIYTQPNRIYSNQFLNVNLLV